MPESIYIILGIILIIVGAIGTIAPALPGLPLCWIGLLLLKFEPSVQNNISWTAIVITGIFTLIITILDNVLPVWTTKKMGGGKRVVLGATIGLLVGFFLGPLGIIFGPFVGAFIGGLTAGSEVKTAAKHATGAFLGYIAGLVMKLICVGLIAFFFIKTLM